MSHKPQLFSGARGVIKIAGKPMAIVTDISVNTRENLRPSYVVGELNPITIEPLSLDVDCSIGRLVPVNTTGGTANTSQATALDLGLEPSISNILTAEALDIEILDKEVGKGGTGRTIAVVKEARFTGRSLSVNSGDVAQERLNFVGIYISVPTDKDFNMSTSASEGSTGTGYDNY